MLLQPRRWTVAGALAVILLAAFLAGRYTRPQKTGPEQLANIAQPKTGGDRVLMVAVGDHLDRTEMILVELVNTKTTGKVDISAERDLAQSLVNENRLYRQTAQRDKDPEIAGVVRKQQHWRPLAMQNCKHALNGNHLRWGEALRQTVLAHTSRMTRQTEQ